MEEEKQLTIPQPQMPNPIVALMQIISFPAVVLAQLLTNFTQQLSGFAPSQGSTYSNKETWVWTDWRGRERSITVYRNAREE